LDNLIAIVDRNGLQNDGYCDQVMPMDSIQEKFKAFGWETTEIDGHDMSQVVDALARAKTLGGKPHCIVARTVKGKGVSYMENKRDWHGKPPNAEQYAQAVQELKGAGL
jgi:transketolase